MIFTNKSLSQPVNNPARLRFLWIRGFGLAHMGPLTRIGKINYIHCCALARSHSFSLHRFCPNENHKSSMGFAAANSVTGVHGQLAWNGNFVLLWASVFSRCHSSCEWPTDTSVSSRERIPPKPCWPQCICHSPAPEEVSRDQFQVLIQDPSQIQDSIWSANFSFAPRQESTPNQGQTPTANATDKRSEWAIQRVPAFTGWNLQIIGDQRTYAYTALPAMIAPIVRWTNSWTEFRGPWVSNSSPPNN